MRVPKMLIAVGAVFIVVLGVDFVAAVYAEYRLARTVRDVTGLNFDPAAVILGFPFLSQAREHQYSEIEIKVQGADHPVSGKASREATLHSVGVEQASWLIKPHADMPVAQVESRIIIDSTHLGRLLGIADLMVNAPDTDEAPTESGISGSTGLIFTGTPPVPTITEPISVAVDLAITGIDRSTLICAPTDVLIGPGTADRRVADEDKEAVLAAFTATIPEQRLPFGVLPSSVGVRGSDIVIEGIADDVIIRLDQFAA